MLRKILISISLLVGFAVSGAVFADDVDEKDKEDFELDDISRIILGFDHHTFDRISDRLFDRISTYNMAIPIGKNVTAVGHVRRNVYPHGDGTFSVLDAFGVRGIVAVGEATEVAGVPVYGSIGGEHGWDFLNIKQFDHKLKIGPKPEVSDQQKEAWTEEFWDEIKEKWFGFKFLIDFLENSTDSVLDHIRSPSDRFHARYMKAFNLTRIPFHLPLSREGFEKMEPGEIYSWTTFTGAFFSVGALTGQLPWQGSVSLNIYLRGSYRVTVMKEMEGNWARIKVSRMLSDGHTITGKVGWDFDLIEDVLFGSDLSISIVPFRLDASEADIKIFDSLYRYNMDSAEGTEAYQEAVFFNFIKSDELSQTSLNVEKIHDKETVTDASASRLGFNVFLFRGATALQRDDSLITVTDKNGVHYVFRSGSQNEIRRGHIFRSSQERVSYVIQASVELENLESNARALDPVILASAMISDRDAYGYELRDYFQMIESLVQDPQLFDESIYFSQTDYGKMSVALHFKFGAKAIERVLQASDADLWSALAKAFGVAVSDWSTPSQRERWVSWLTYLRAFPFRDERAIQRLTVLKHAKGIADQFHKIRDEYDVRERIRKFTQFHKETPFRWEILTVMFQLAQLARDPEKRFEDLYAVLLVRGRHVAPKYQQWGSDISVKHPNLYENEDREMSGRPQILRHRIVDIKISHPPAAEHIRLSFKTDADPSDIEGFYFRIYKNSWLWFRESFFQTDYTEDLFTNFEVDEDGRMIIFLDQALKGRKLRLGKRYEVALAFRRHDGIWSSEPSFLFEYERKENMDIQWLRPR